MGTPFSGNPSGRPRFNFVGGPLPAGIKALIIANVAVFLVQFVVGRSLDNLLGLRSSDVVEGLRIWQPFTYLFLHSTQNMFHLVFNMLMLWMFGTDLERRWGTQAFLQFYFFCGIGAGVINIAVDYAAWGLGFREIMLPTIGASGAIYGLLAAHGILFPNRMILLFLFFPMRMRPAVLLLAGIMLFTALGASNSAINNVAHLGGMAFAWIYLHRAWNLRRIWSEWRWKARRRRYKVVSDIRDDDRHQFH